MHKRIASLALTFVIPVILLSTLFGLLFAPKATLTYANADHHTVYLPVVFKQHDSAQWLDLTLLHTNDVHGRVDQFHRNGGFCRPEEAMTVTLCIGGSARIATVVREIRATAQNVLLLDAGDQFQGTLFYNLFKSDVISDMMNRLEYDAMAIGNHEFDDGPVELARLIAGARFPVLSANIDASADPDLRNKLLPYHIFTQSGHRIAVVGLTTPDTPITSSPGPTIGFTNPITLLQTTVNSLTAQGIDKIIALTHLGYAEDIALAQAVNGVDVIIGGHSHSFLYNPYTPNTPISFTLPATTTLYPLTPIGSYPTVITKTNQPSTLIVTAYQWSTFLGRLNITFGPDGTVHYYDGNPIFLNGSIAKDPEIETALEPYRAEIQELINTVVGTTTVDLPINVSGINICRREECLMGNLVADAMLWKARQVDPQMQIAIQNGGGLRAPLAAGTVSMGGVLQVLPFGNTLATFEMTGANIRVALENGVSSVATLSGRFPQVAGMRYSFDLSQPVGSRIQAVDVWIDSAYQPLNETMLYKVVTNDFMRRGGDGYSIFRTAAINPYDFGPAVDEAMAQYITLNSPVTPVLQGRITNVTPPPTR